MELFGFGLNAFGQLGSPPQVPTVCLEPHRIPLPRPVSQAAAGDSHSVVLLDDGQVVAWGNNLFGQCGQSSPLPVTAPSPLGHATGVCLVACGGWHTALVHTTRALSVLGLNRFGQLGTPALDLPHTPFPVLVEGVEAERVSCGAYHTCVVGPGARACTFGRGQQGQLGWPEGGQRLRDATYGVRDSSSPVVWCGPPPVHKGKRGLSRASGEGGGGWDCVVAGQQHTFAIADDGRLFVCGAALHSHRLGVGDECTTLKSLHQVALPGARVKQVACGSQHTVALDAQGQVWAWGSNEFGQLGLGGPSHVAGQPQPCLVDAFSRQGVNVAKVVQVACGNHFTVAVTEDGALYEWGLVRATEGQQPGIDGRAPCGKPRLVGGVLANASVHSVACGAGHVLVLANPRAGC